jgi:hypothetical protein
MKKLLISAIMLSIMAFAVQANPFPANLLTSEGTRLELALVQRHYPNLIILQHPDTFTLIPPPPPNAGYYMFIWYGINRGFGYSNGPFHGAIRVIFDPEKEKWIGIFDYQVDY